MSKIIRFDENVLAEMREEFEKALKSAKLVDGRFSFIKSFSSLTDRATLLFTELAWLKMNALVDSFEKEVAWHCVAERWEGENEYIISDILVYPQTVTGVTVDMETEEYARWVENGIISGDDRFFHLHGQGHSHVNMGVSPSGTDLEHQQTILHDVREDGFYIFMIWNKRADRSIWIYDLQKNKVFETKDITVKTIEEENGVVAFLREARKLVKADTVAALYPPVKPYTASSGSKQAETTGTTYSKDNKDGKKSGADKPKVKAKPAWSDDDDDPTDPFYVRDSYYYGRSYNYGMY